MGCSSDTCDPDILVQVAYSSGLYAVTSSAVYSFKVDALIARPEKSAVFSHFVERVRPGTPTYLPRAALVAVIMLGA